MSQLSIEVTPLDLPLVHPFRIARGEERVAKTAVVRVRAGEREGIGEATPVGRYDETVESVVRELEAYRPATHDPYRLETLLDPALPPAARAGLDLALHDLIGKDTGKPLYELLGLDPGKTPVTSFTVGIADPDETLRKVDAIGDHPILKVKLGEGSDARQVETIAAIRTRFTGTLRIDANEGWNVDQAIAILRDLERFDIEFCEQPIPAGSPAGLRAVSEATSIPIVTDEDSIDARDLPKLYGCVDGINVKLTKCGGIRAGLAMIHTARALNFKIMLGCMVESAIAATAAAHLSPLVDWADIDGPFLTARDPFVGVTYDRGKLMLPDAPGLGIREAAVA